MREGDIGSLTDIQRELRLAVEATRQPGAGAIGNLECRLADLQQRFLGTPARTLADVEARLEVVRDLVAGLGPRGWLLDLVEATLDDVRRLRRADAPEPQ